MTRVVYGAFVLVIAAFVVSNVSQVARVVFAERDEPETADQAAGPKVGAACGAAMSAELRSIEAARQAASTELDVESAKRRYGEERRGSGTANTANAKTACEADPHGTDALAAVARLDRAAESHVLRDVGELRPVRLAAQSFISGHPR